MKHIETNFLTTTTLFLLCRPVEDYVRVGLTSNAIRLPYVPRLVLDVALPPPPSSLGLTRE
jgi:hypothetical protein